jgi:hypothetical protein
VNKKNRASNELISKIINSKRSRATLVIEASPSLVRVDFTQLEIHVIDDLVSLPLGRPWLTEILFPLKPKGGR